MNTRSQGSLRIVCIGGGPQVFDLVGETLDSRRRDFTIVSTATAEEGIGAAKRENPQLIVVKSDFNDLSLGDAIAKLREFTRCILIVLSCAGDELEHVTALERGADCYLRFPGCTMRELEAEMGALLRRSLQLAIEGEREVPAGGELVLNISTREVFLDGEEISLTKLEFDILKLLVRVEGRALSNAYILREVWGSDYDTEGVVKWHVSNLRGKIGDSNGNIWIRTIRGFGYRLLRPVVVVVAPPLSIPLIRELGEGGRKTLTLSSG